MTRITTTLRRSLAASLMATMLLPAAPVAQGRGKPVEAPSAPLSSEIVLAAPDAYYGKLVTLSIGVDEILSKTAFTVDQRRVAPGSKTVSKIGKPLLVVAPTLTATPDTARYLTIVGELVKFDAAALAAKVPGYRVDLPPAAIEKYQGRPVLLATKVLSSTFVELTKQAAQ